MGGLLSKPPNRLQQYLSVHEHTVPKILQTSRGTVGWPKPKIDGRPAPVCLCQPDPHYALPGCSFPFPIVWAFVLGFFSYTPIRTGTWFLGLGGQNPFVGIGNYFELFTGTGKPAEVFRMAIRTRFYSLCCRAPKPSHHAPAGSSPGNVPKKQRRYSGLSIFFPPFLLLSRLSLSGHTCTPQAGDC